jgi:release factor glutamine methyltransferase
MTAAVATMAQAATIAGARRALGQAFRARGLDTPELDARVLVAHALGLDHAGLAAQSERALTRAEIDAIEAAAARRLGREPVARIIGSKEFWGLNFKLDAATLVPRPETETVVEAALAALVPRPQGGLRLPALRLADLGTGSGALLLALLSELPTAFGVGTDISVAALARARENAVAHGLEARAAFVACDYAAALTGPFDLIVSNPPYVARDEIALLAPEVRDFDPRRALDGGPDGLAAYRVIAEAARRLLSPAGHLVLELGIGQLDAVTHLLADAGLIAAGGARHDLGGVARALTVRLAQSTSRHEPSTFQARKKALGLRPEND